MEAKLETIAMELRRRPLYMNRSRKVSGLGRSQTFGVVSRWSLPPDYSAICFKRPYLFKLLLDFGDAFVHTSFNAITVNQNYKCLPHRDLSNQGDSSIVAFGNYTGGELRIHGEGSMSGTHDIKNRILVADFSKLTHSVCEFNGDRYSLVFYYRPVAPGLPTASVKWEDGKWWFYRGCERIDRGLPHPRRRDFCAVKTKRSNARASNSATKKQKITVSV